MNKDHQTKKWAGREILKSLMNIESDVEEYKKLLDVFTENTSGA